MTEFECNLTQIYESVWKDLFNALPVTIQAKVMLAKTNPELHDDDVDVFVSRVIEKAESVYDKSLTDARNKKQ